MKKTVEEWVTFAEKLAAKNGGTAGRPGTLKRRAACPRPRKGAKQP